MIGLVVAVCFSSLRTNSRFSSTSVCNTNAPTVDAPIITPLDTFKDSDELPSENEEWNTGGGTGTGTINPVTEVEVLNEEESDVIFSNEYDGSSADTDGNSASTSSISRSSSTGGSSSTSSSTSSTGSSRQARMWSSNMRQISAFPDNAYIHLAYDHLAFHALRAVEAVPTLRFTKPDTYLAAWWDAVLRWGILSDKMRDVIDAEPVYSINYDFESVLNFPRTGCFAEDDPSMNPNKIIPKPLENTVPISSISYISPGEYMNTSAHYRKANPYRRRVPYRALHRLCVQHRARVICIGDVHGCIDELCDLLREVDYRPGDTVLFLGDLVAKGPNATAVIRLAMDISALSVRGNHDHEVVKHGV